jgi:glycerophosphoryl diester phosphodiesterase
MLIKYIRKEGITMKIIAHRSGTGVYPEQTIAAAAKSLEQGADYVEMDIRYTSDKVPVICHDTSALRIFGKNSDIDKLTLTEFLSLRHVSDRRYPSHSLDDVISCGIAPLLLHCKITGSLIKDLLSHLRKSDYEDKIILGVQHSEDVITIKNFNPSIKTLAFMRSPEDYEFYVNNGVDIIRLWEQWLTEELIEKVISTGCKVWIMARDPDLGGTGYTREENLHLWEDMGIDGVLVDDVGWAIKAIGNRKSI